MVYPSQIKEIIEKKKGGALNSVLMKEYKISYAELRTILDSNKEDKEIENV